MEMPFDLETAEQRTQRHLLDHMRSISNAYYQIGTLPAHLSLQFDSMAILPALYVNLLFSIEIGLKTILQISQNENQLIKGHDLLFLYNKLTTNHKDNISKLSGISFDKILSVLHEIRNDFVDSRYYYQNVLLMSSFKIGNRTAITTALAKAVNEYLYELIPPQY